MEEIEIKMHNSVIENHMRSDNFAYIRSQREKNNHYKQYDNQFKVHAYMIYALMLLLGVNILGLSMSAVALGMISFLFPIYYYRSGR